MMLTDLADVLRAAGCDVLELPGWKTRGESDGPFNPLGIILHHDGMGLGFNGNPSDDLNVPKYMSQNGVNGAQLWISRTGQVVVLAAGRKWHAGVGPGYGQIRANNGNTDAIGIETDHTTGNPWPAAQVAAINLVSRTLARRYGWKSSNCCGHREYAPGRKPDPENFDLNAWRAFIGAPAHAGGGSSAPTPAPKPQPAPATYTVRQGDTLSAIADRYRYPGGWQALARANGIKDPNVITPGQVIRLTGSAPAPKPTPAPAKPSIPAEKRYRPMPGGRWPFTPPDYVGDIAGDNHSHGGGAPGDGPIVDWVQRALWALGYGKAAPDGKFEAVNCTWLANWQRDYYRAHGLRLQYPGRCYGDDARYLDAEWKAKG